METYKFNLKIPDPFDFRLTVRKPAGWHWATPLEVFEDGVLYTALRLADGKLAGLSMRSDGDSVTTNVYCRRKLDENQRDELEKRILLGLGAYDDLKGFYSLGKNDPLVAKITSDLYGMRTGLAGDVFERALLAILLQMAPMRRSNDMMRSLIENYGDPISLEGKRVVFWPSAKTVAGASVGDLARKCKLGYRAKFVKAVAERLIDGFPGILELKQMSADEAVKRLQTLPGIGSYSAQIISPHPGFPLDVWSSRIFAEILLGRTPDNPRGVIAEVEEEAIRRWGDYRWQIFVYALHDLPNLMKMYEITKPV